MRSVLDIGFSTRVPQQNATIPYGYYANGAPFALYSQGEITSFKIVCLRTRIETDLSTTIILSEDSKRYYKATHDLGVPRGSYFYKLGIGEVETDPKVVGLTGNNGLYYPSEKMYGIWEFDLDITEGWGFTIAFISDGTNVNYDSYHIYTSGGLFQFYSYTGGVSDNLFSTNGVTDIEKITIKRNETTNQYFTGAADAFAFYVNGTLIDDSVAIEGTNPIVDTNPSITSSIDTVFITGEGGVLYNPPASYTVWAGSWEFVPGGTTGGSKLYSQVFKIDEYMRGPTPEVGDFSSSDFNNDFLNFEATGVIDENGDEC